MSLYFIFSSAVPYIVINVAHSKIDHKLLDNTDSSLTQTLLLETHLLLQMTTQE